VTTITNRNTRGVLSRDITVTADRDRPRFATNPALTTFSFGAAASLLLLALGSFPDCLSLILLIGIRREFFLMSSPPLAEEITAALLREVNSAQ
jgi:hypothetical protein